MEEILFPLSVLSVSGDQAAVLTTVNEAESQEVNREVDSFLQSQLVKDILQDSEIKTIRSNLKLPPVALDNTVDSELDSEVDKDPDVEQLEQQELDSLLMPPPTAIPPGGDCSSSKKSMNGILQRPALASLGIKDTVQECMKDESKGWYFS